MTKRPSLSNFGHWTPHFGFPASDFSGKFRVTFCVRLSRSIWFILAALLLFGEVHNVYGQWKSIAPNIVAPPYSLFGAMSYHNGTIIAAISGTVICISSDDGKTWQTVAAPYAVDDQPQDVDIFDGQNAIIATYKSGLYITHDGGLTWAATGLITALNAAKFLGTAKDIIAAAPFGRLLISQDAGITWNQISASGSTGQNDIQVRKKDLSIYASETGGNSGGGNFGYINSTTDGGSTWNQASGRFNTDTHNFAIDPCNDSLLYVINEANFNPGPDGFGHIFFSHNSGKTFTAVNTMDIKYYCGSILCAPGGTLYLQTQTSDGILRSTDRGFTWKSIGGPDGFSDCRLICCKDDNTIFGVDKQGSIWKTLNSGGDSLTTSKGGSLVVTPGILFDNDTVYCLDSVSRQLTLTISGCPPPTITGLSFIGKDALSYSAGKILQNSVSITFMPKKLGDHRGILLLNLSNGKQDTVLLRGYNDSKPSQYYFSPKILFVNDTIRCIDSIVRTIAYITSGCLPPTITGWSVIGMDSLSYSVVSSASHSLDVTFTPKKLGDHNDTLLIDLSNGNRDTIILKGYNDSQPFQYSFTPVPLFLTDTVTLCDTQVQKAVLRTSGCVPKIISQGITGDGLNNYRTMKPIKEPLVSGDTLIIEFKPNTGGVHHALYEAILSDGTKISLPLEGVGKDVPFTFSFNPPLLFKTDSVYLCSPGIGNKVFISVAGCRIPDVISQIISGTSSSDYMIIRNVNNSIDHSDSLLIDFKPSAGGMRTATLTLTFADGSMVKIPLQGFGISPHQIILTTNDQSTNTIGGSVDAPITINGLDHDEDVDLVLHYNSELTYHGSYSPMNLQLDIPGSQWSGRSKLHIPQVKPNMIVGYARFDVFNDSLSKSQVRFDSVIVMTAVVPCQYILPLSVTSIITPPSDCGADIISRFLHNGTVPQLTITPNPTGGEVWIRATQDLGEVSIGVYTMLGVQIMMKTLTIEKNTSTKIMLPEVRGMYNMRVRSAENNWDLRVIVNR